MLRMTLNLNRRERSSKSQIDPALHVQHQNPLTLAYIATTKNTKQTVRKHVHSISTAPNQNKPTPASCYSSPAGDSGLKLLHGAGAGSCSRRAANRDTPSVTRLNRGGGDSPSSTPSPSSGANHVA
jgi:hypothetical protein